MIHRPRSSDSPSHPRLFAVMPQVGARRAVSLGRDPDEPLELTSGPRVTCEDVVALYRVPAAVVARWAREDGWTRHGDGPVPRWSLDQVQASYERRELTSPQATHDDRADSRSPDRPAN